MHPGIISTNQREKRGKGYEESNHSHVTGEEAEKRVYHLADGL
jgi:hypothetical protein